MADFSVLSGQIADAVAQSNEPAAAQSSSQSLAVVQQAMAQAVSLSMQNAVAAQQQMNVLSQAITTQAINRLMNANPATTGATQSVDATSDPFDQLLTMLNTMASGSKQ